MQIKIAELKAEKARLEGRRITWLEIEEATGIRNNALIAMNNGSARQVRPEYIDALCAYFAVGVERLCAADAIDLPLGELRQSGLLATTVDAETREAFVQHVRGAVQLDDDDVDALLGALWHSKDPLPDDVAALLHIDLPATFAQAAQRYRAQIGAR